MERVTTSLTIRYSIHADAWTETLAGLQYLTDQIETLEKSGDSVNKIYLTRVTIISSSYLAEQVFAQASKKYIDQKLTCRSVSTLTKDLLKDWKRRNSIRKIGISRAIKEWPKVLTGNPLKLGDEPLQSLKKMVDKRNDIIHKLSDLTHYEQASDVARSALYTAVEASKTIESHFFPGKNFSYSEWLNKYPIPSGPYFGRFKI